MQKEEKELQRGALALIAISTAVIELLLTWMFIILTIIPAIAKGYWYIVGLGLAVYIVVSYLWLKLMLKFFSKKSRKRIIEGLKEVTKDEPTQK